MRKEGTIKKVRKYIGEMEQGLHEKELSLMRMKMQPRWAEAQGCSIEQIDYSDPYVSLEWKLVDPAVRRTLKSGTDKERAEIMSTWTEEELALYYNANGQYNDTSYQKQIEDGNFLKNVGKALIHKVKG